MELKDLTIEQIRVLMKNRMPELTDAECETSEELVELGLADRITVEDDEDGAYEYTIYDTSEEGEELLDYAERRLLLAINQMDRTMSIADKYGIDFTVALDIDYLHILEDRIVAAAKMGNKNFPVHNEKLEEVLNECEKT